MGRFIGLFVVFVVASVAATEYHPRSGNQLVNSVLKNCADVGCVKNNVLGYLDSLLNMQTDARSIKDIDQAIFKRAARVMKTHEFRFKLPAMVFDNSEIVYNPKSGLDVTSPTEERGLGLKKKLLFPILLLLKLKMKALMPIFVAMIGIKALKALILSKLAVAIVLGFVAYQLLGKGMPMPMPMPMTMTPIEAPTSMYGAPPTTSPPSSYEPGWEPSGTGPYSRVWNAASSGSGSSSDSAQSIAYSSYYPGTSSSTIRP